MNEEKELGRRTRELIRRSFFLIVMLCLTLGIMQESIRSVDGGLAQWMECCEMGMDQEKQENSKEQAVDDFDFRSASNHVHLKSDLESTNAFVMHWNDVHSAVTTPPPERKLS